MDKNKRYSQEFKEEAVRYRKSYPEKMAGSITLNTALKVSWERIPIYSDCGCGFFIPDMRTDVV